MFFGDIREGSEIEIPDCSPLAFRAVIQWIGEGVPWNTTNIGDVFYVMVKYMLDDMVKATLDRVAEIDVEDLTTDLLNIVDLYVISIRHGHKKAKNNLESILESNLPSIFQLESLLKLNEEQVEEVLRCSDEHELPKFLFVDKWIKFNGKKTSSLLDFINIGELTLDEINTFVRPSGYFSIDELFDIVVHKTTNFVYSK